MARFPCKCGETLSNSMAPNDIELRVYTDKEWDDIINLGMIEAVDLPIPKYDVWRCPKCERIYVFDGESLVKTYVVEREQLSPGITARALCVLSLAAKP